MKRYIKMKRWMKPPSSVVFPELRPSFRLISKREAKICQQCQAQLMEVTRFCPQCGTPVPQPPVGNVAHGKQEYQRQRLDKCDKAVQLDPNDPWSYNNRGRAYADLGEHQRAIQDYDKAIQLDPNDPWGYNFRGRAYQKLGQASKAKQDFAKFRSLAPKM